MYKRDFSAPTLEDHFNKTILPKVMQVSCFHSCFMFHFTVEDVLQLRLLEHCQRFTMNSPLKHLPNVSICIFKHYFFQPLKLLNLLITQEF